MTLTKTITTESPTKEQVLVEEQYPEGRIAARVAMRRDPRTGELSYTPSAIRTLDRLRGLLMKVTSSSSPGHIRALREGLGLTQQQLAEKLKVTSQSVSRWERGEVQPNQAAIARLVRLQTSARQTGIAVKH
jgi:DNA-binding transcriptional regulator YiaG